MSDDHSEEAVHMDHKWQFVSTDGADNNIHTHRMRVRAGWLYRVMGIYLQAHGGNTIAVTFVPDRPFEPPDGGWGSS